MAQRPGERGSVSCSQRAVHGFLRARLSLPSLSLSNKGGGDNVHPEEPLPTQQSEPLCSELPHGHSPWPNTKSLSLLSALHKHIFSSVSPEVKMPGLGTGCRKCCGTAGTEPMGSGSGGHLLCRFSRSLGCGPHELGLVSPTPERPCSQQEKAPAHYRKAASQLVLVAKHLGKMPV